MGGINNNPTPAPLLPPLTTYDSGPFPRIPEESGEFWEGRRPGHRLVLGSLEAGREAKLLEYSRPGSPAELRDWSRTEKAGLDEAL